MKITRVVTRSNLCEFVVRLATAIRLITTNRPHPWLAKPSEVLRLPDNCRGFRLLPIWRPALLQIAIGRTIPPGRLLQCHVRWSFQPV
jgi:hypothetical protein